MADTSPEGREDWVWLAKSLTGAEVTHVSPALKESVKAAIKFEVGRLWTASGRLGPPFDPLRIASFRRVTEIAEVSLARDAALVPGPMGFQLKLRPGLGNHRRRSAIAHEIGHTFFYNLRPTVPEHAIRRSERNLSNDHEEWLAQRIGREILIPSAALERELDLLDCPSIVAFGTLCERFDVSPDIMAWRLFRDLGAWDVLFVLATARGRALDFTPRDSFRGHTFRRFLLRKLREPSPLGGILDPVIGGETRITEAFVPGSQTGVGDVVIEACAVSEWPRRVVVLGRPGLPPRSGIPPPRF